MSNKTDIAKELLKNSSNVYIKEFLNTYIACINDLDKEREDLIRLDNCISYIDNVNFNIQGWGLWDIPIFYSHCFLNIYTGEAFDLAVWDIGEVIPRYMDENYNEQDALDIQEAIKKYYRSMYEELCQSLKNKL